MADKSEVSHSKDSEVAQEEPFVKLDKSALKSRGRLNIKSCVNRVYPVISRSTRNKATVGFASDNKVSVKTGKNISSKIYPSPGNEIQKILEVPIEANLEDQSDIISNKIQALDLKKKSPSNNTVHYKRPHIRKNSIYRPFWAKEEVSNGIESSQTSSDNVENTSLTICQKDLTSDTNARPLEVEKNEEEDEVLLNGSNIEVKKTLVGELQEVYHSTKNAVKNLPAAGARKLRYMPSGERLYSLGEARSSYTSQPTNYQDFNEIRSQCLAEGRLFEDPEFLPNDRSLYYSQRPDRRFEWLRPQEICEDPQLFVEGYSRFDVQQGELGDCWLLAAVANLTLYRKLFFQVVPDDQSFDDGEYAGVFHFRFWQYGRWVDVVIDDRLPTHRGKLVYLRSSEKNEFWSALLEKAYAKLHGSYEALKGGSTCEAMEDFTGGVTEMYEMSEVPPNLYTILLKAYERSSLMGCSIEPDPSVLEAETPEGLIRGHAYSITRVKNVDIETPGRSGKIPLLRLRNPWGNEAEWNGPWSDKSPEWRFIPESEKEELGLTFDDDGEFWMSYRDFISHFSRMEICNLNPDSLDPEDSAEGCSKKWEMSVFEGEWVRGVTAGGCRNFLESFWRNPQYTITLSDVDEGDNENECTIIVALMQKNRRSQRDKGLECLTIGFALYKLPERGHVPKPLDINYFKYNASVARSPSFINLREVSCRFKLPPGSYVIVPSTFDPNDEGEFLLRVFSEKCNNMEENDEELGMGEVDDRVGGGGYGGGANVKDETPDPEPSDPVRQFFNRLAGDDGEVDWQELKEILDYAMREELAMRKGAGGAAYDGGGVPGGGAPQQERGFIEQLLCALCAPICKEFGVDVDQAAENPETVQLKQPELRGEGFSKDVCRSMVAMLDKDGSGKLGFDEFKSLWVDLRQWRAVFRLYDTEGRGAVPAHSLRDALHSAGYTLNAHVLNVLAHRYGSQDGYIQFDDFIMCAVRLKTMIDKFHGSAVGGSRATFSLDDWIQHTVYS